LAGGGRAAVVDDDTASSKPWGSRPSGDERLRWAARKAADVIEKLAGEPVAFGIVMQPIEAGACQTVSNLGKEALINLLLHAAEGLMTGRSIDVEARRAN
jgi:hypothetical protein